MPISDARKAANAKWDKENMCTLACKVKKEEAAAFKEHCARQGKTSNTVLKEFVLEAIKRDGAEDEQA